MQRRKSAILVVWLIAIIIILNIFLSNIKLAFNYSVSSCQNSDTSLNDDDDDSSVISTIPRLIHFVYLKGDNGMILDAYRPYIKKCMEVNPKMKFVLWTKENMNLFLKNFATDDMRMHMNESRRKLIHRSDVFRYIVIYYFGGIYMDLDTICFKPIYPHVRNETFVLAIEPTIHTRIYLGIERIIANFFFASEPRHPFMQHLLNNLKRESSKSDSVLHTTGPIYVDQQYAQYIAKHSETNIHVLTSLKFFPQLNIPFLRDICNTKNISACKELESFSIWLKTEGLKDAVIAHEGLGHGWKETRGPYFNVRGEFPTLNFWP